MSALKHMMNRGTAHPIHRDRRYYDLNLDTILSGWTVSDAIRELLANAVDEHTLCSVGERVQVNHIPEYPGYVTIQDFGRGLKIEHLRLNESTEKNNSELTMGNFGFGLKDALGFLYSNGCQVSIQSQHCHISSLKMFPKHGFSDMNTLNAVVDPGSPEMVGTKVTVKGVSDIQLALAMDNFLYFREDKLLHANQYGEIYERSADSASIYINGLKVNSDVCYAFSYNITRKNAAIRKGMNRERKNMGLSVTTPMIKKIIMDTRLPDQLIELMHGEYSSGREIKLKDVREYIHKEYVRIHTLQGQDIFKMPDSASGLKCHGPVSIQELNRVEKYNYNRCIQTHKHLSIPPVDIRVYARIDFKDKPKPSVLWNGKIYLTRSLLANTERCLGNVLSVMISSITDKDRQHECMIHIFGVYGSSIQDSL
jgi:hypothetical protein